MEKLLFDKDSFVFKDIGGSSIESTSLLILLLTFPDVKLYKYICILFKVPNSRDNVYSHQLSACYP
jgi:hypothetical protein